MRIVSIMPIILCWLLTISCTPKTASVEILKTNTNYLELIALFKVFRKLQEVPSEKRILYYTSDAIARRWEKLRDYQHQLQTFNVSEWTVSKKVNYHLVRAEMNGMEFNHRVLRPWSRNPNFYLNRIPLPEEAMKFPLDDMELDYLTQGLKDIPAFFEQAMENMKELSRVSGDFASFAIHNLEHDNPLKWLSDQDASQYPELEPLIKGSNDAMDHYLHWLKENQYLMKEPPGVGKDHYNWALKNVYLFPYTWQECLSIVELEDNRVITFRELEKNRNRKLPLLKPDTSQEQYIKRYTQTINGVITFIKENEIFTVQEYLVPEAYIAEEKSRGPYGLGKPWPKKHDYFFNFSLREPMMLETHEMIGHHFDLLRALHDDRPIRGDREHEGSYHVSVARLEGFAFALEELMMHAGYLDEQSSRSREITYNQAAFRTVRAISDLRMHNLDWSLDDAMKYCVRNAPNGHLLAGSPHLWHEMHSTLTMVGWHMQMVVGKVQFMKLLGDRSQQLGDDFVLKDFMDEYFAAGVIPTSLIRWEMTGMTDEIERLVN